MKAGRIITFWLVFALLAVSFASADRYVNYNAKYATIDSDGNLVTTTQPITNFNVLGYVCADSSCSSVSGTLWNGQSLSSGGSSTIQLTYPTNLLSSYGYGIYYYKPGYITWESNANYWGTIFSDPAGPYEIYLAKAEACHAPIEDFTVINDVQPNVPLVIGVSASLDATTYSALKHAGPLDYVPPQLKDDYYSVKTRVTLQIVRVATGEVVNQQVKDVLLDYSGSKRVEFSWTPTVVGRYKAVVKTDVIDSKCLSSVEQNSQKQFNVLSEDPRNMCYTLLNNLATSNQFPWEGEEVDLSLTKISNYADLDYLLYPTKTDLTVTVKRKSDNKVVYTNAQTVAKNADSETPRTVSVAWDTTGLQHGYYEVEVTGIANDPRCAGLENIPETVSLTTYLDGPSAYQPNIEGIPDLSMPEDYPDAHVNWVNLRTYTTDPDNTLDEITYYIVSQSNSGLVNCRLDSGHYISCDAPAPDQWGSSTIVVEANDGNYSDRDSFLVTVVAQNDRPLIGNIPNLNMNEGECTTLPDNHNLDFYVSDPDNTADELTWTSSGGSNVIVTINADRTVSFCSPSDWNGFEIISFTVTDPSGSSDTDNVQVNVGAVNDAPVISPAIPDVTFVEGGCDSLNLDLDDYVTDVDNADSELTWTASGNVNIAVTIDPATHAVSFCRGMGWFGAETVTFTVTDPAGLSDSDDILVTVTESPERPPVMNIPDYVLLWNSGLHDNLVDLSAYSSDPNNDALIYLITAQTNTGVVECAMDSNRYIDCDVKPGMLGSSDVTVSATDGIFTVLDTFTISVVQNITPGGLSVSVISPNGGEVLSGRTNITWIAVSSNGCADPLSIMIEYSPDLGLTWNTIAANEANDGIYGWDISALPAYGTYLVRVTATDCAATASDVSDRPFTINNNPSRFEDEDFLEYRLGVPQLTFIEGEIYSPGTVFHTKFRLDNNGDYNLKDIKVTVVSTELGIRDSVGPFDLRKGDEVTKSLSLEIPRYAAPGEYDLRFTFSCGNVKRTKHRIITVI